MDSNQPATKRGFEVMSLENQDDGMSNTSEEGGDGAETKRFKQELHPLQMGSVLEQIFSNLDVESIKAARQVNPLWSVEGAKSLMSKCYVKIPSAIRVGEEASRFKAMDEFKAFLSHKSSDFSTIRNITVDEVADVELWKYLGVGEQVTSLKIEKIPAKNEEEFSKNLLNLLPSLNYLGSDELDEEPKLIRVLTSVITTLEQNRKSLVISFLNLHPENEEQLAEIEKFVECKKVMIEELIFNFQLHLHSVPSFVTRVSNMLNKLLSTSQTILKKLTLVNCNLVLPLLDIPCMTALTEIFLDFIFETAGQLSQCKFPPNFRISEKFPKLKDIEMYGNLKQKIARHCFINLFQSVGIAPSVEKVFCWGNVSDYDIFHIFKSFPNLKRFGTNVSQNSREMLRSLWKRGKNLKYLRLDVDWQPPLVKTDELDASFTGLAAWTVDKIKKTPNLDSFTLEDVEDLRIYPSILNLEELKNIGLYFHGHARDYSNRILAVAGKFAFELMPKSPKIDIFVKKGSTLDEIKKAFDEISKLPNVSLSNFDEDD